MSALACASSTMFFCYASKGFVHLSIEIEGSLVDEDVEACSLEHSLDL